MILPFQSLFSYIVIALPNSLLVQRPFAFSPGTVIVDFRHCFITGKVSND